MTEPIVLRSEAINRLQAALDQNGLNGTSTTEQQAQINALSSSSSSAATSLATLRSDIVDIKEAIKLLKAQMAEVAEKAGATIEGIETTGADAPTEEDEQEGAVIYRVDLGAINSAKFESNSSTFAKHYVYDVLHVVEINTAFSSDSQTSNDVELATFPNLVGYSGSGYLAPVPGITNYTIINDDNYATSSSGTLKINGNKVHLTLGDSTTVDTSLRYMSGFWFDRSTAPRVFNIEDGALLSSVVSPSTPYHATHAYLGNLHFLTINTKTVQKITAKTNTTIAQFQGNLSIPCGVHMGVCSVQPSVLSAQFHAYVSAPNINSISIYSNNDDIPADSFLTINLIWLDNKATSSDAVVKVGSPRSLPSSDAFAKHFIYKHINAVQIYGNVANRDKSLNVGATFEDDVILPTYDSNITTFDNIIRTEAQLMGGEKQRLGLKLTWQHDNNKSFTATLPLSLMNYSDAGYTNFTMLWFA